MNFPNGKKYIGITKQKVEKRWLKGNGYKKNKYMFRAIQKYGWDNIKHIILYDNLTKEEAEQKEVELISNYKSNKRKFGYNIENGGHAHCVSEETKKKNSNAFKGEKHPMYGKHHSHEAKIKIGLASLGRTPYNKGIKMTDQQRKKLSEISKGKHYSPKTEFKKGQQMTKEQIQKMINSKKGKIYPKFIESLKKIQENNRKKVLCIETNKIYDSIKDAAQENNLCVQNISKVCYGKRKTTGGFHWEFYKEMI